VTRAGGQASHNGSVAGPLFRHDLYRGTARDLRRELHASAPDGRFRQALSFGYDLARRPGPITRNSHANHPVP
jgi:hypothetical protein